MYKINNNYRSVFDGHLKEWNPNAKIDRQRWSGENWETICINGNLKIIEFTPKLRTIKVKYFSIQDEQPTIFCIMLPYVQFYQYKNLNYFRTTWSLEPINKLTKPCMALLPNIDPKSDVICIPKHINNLIECVEAFWTLTFVLREYHYEHIDNYWGVKRDNDNGYFRFIYLKKWQELSLKTNNFMEIFKTPLPVANMA
jgi:hypothetical protein